MLSIKSYRSLLAITLIFVGFVALFSLEASPVRTAQAPTDYIRHVRNFDADNIGALNPVGLTFSPISANFLVLEANASPSNSNIISVSPLEIRYDSVPIEAAVADPINMTFDSKVGRLLILDSESDELIEIEAASDGSLLPNTLTRHDVQHFGIQNPQGMTIDPLSGHLFVVDEPGPRLIQIEPDSGQGFDNAVISVVGLESTGLEDVRGLAFDPTSTNLHIYSAGDQEITEIDQSGQVLLSRDLSQFEFGSLQAMVFAPSGDSTDDPSHLNLYVADSGSTPVGSEQLATADYESAVSGADYQIFAPVAVAFSGGGGDNRHRAGTIIEFSLTEPISVRTKYASSSVQATLVQTINTYQWSPPSPDSAGIVYLPDSDSLLISDSEVNEMTIFTGVNMFGATLTGGLFDTWSTLAFSNEPTGVTLNTTNGHLFISDDTGTRAVYELNPGPDGLYDTADDTSSYFVTSNFGSSDPEGVTYASSLGVLFVVDGVNSEVYRVAPGSNGLFDGVPPGGDDQVTSFDTMALGLHDPEGIAYNSDTGSLYIAGDMGGYDTLLEVTNTGIFLQTIDVSAANAKYLSGLAFAPSSDNPNARSIYIADRGRDNDQDPNENDGKVYEMALPISGPVAPVANDDNASTIVGTAVTIDVAANDTDVNNNLDPNSANSVCANCTEPTGGLLTDNGDGTITYTPIGDYSGADTFVYEICDTDPLCSTGTVYVSVAPNLPPQANNDTANTTAGLQITIDVAGNDSDPNGNLDPSTTNTDCATCTTPPNGVLFNHGDGTFDYTSNTNFSGIDNFVYQICDTNGACATATVTITVSETPDSLYISTVSDVNIGGVTYADEDILVFDTTTETWSMHFDGSDVGLNAGGQEIDALHINTDGSILLSLGKSGNIAGFGAVDDFDILRFIPTSTGVDTAGTYEMYLDGEDVGLTGEDIDALGFTTDGRIVVSFRGSFTIDGISGNDEDLLAFTASSLGPTTSGSWEFYFDGSDIALDNASTEDTNGIWIDDLGDIQLTVRGAFEVPGVAGDGADIFVCEPLSLGSVTDCNFRMFWDGSTYGLNGEISGIFMNSQQPNDPPQANDDNPGTDEDTLVVINVAGNDSDPDGNLAPNSANTVCATCTLPADGSLANNGDGTFDYNPDLDFNGSDNFVYEICDTFAACDTATVTITVSPVPDAPEANDDNAITQEDVPLPIDVAGNDSDPDGDLDPTTTNTACPSCTSPAGGVVNNGDGTFDYTPPPGYTGADGFVYQICDFGGLCSTATVFITITITNDPPQANDDNPSTNEDTLVMINVAGNDSDPDGNLAPNSANTACATCTLPANGSLANNGDGTFDYNPDLDFNGSDNFVYEICDTLAACDTATVTITVSAVPDAPEANDDDAITQQDTPVPIDVAANDSDPEGDLDPTTTNTACPSCTNPAGGLVNNGDGSFNYTPPPGFTGVDSFVYEICDLGGLCSTAAVSITVTPSTPTTFEVRVAAASDDGEERATGSMYLNSSDLELIFDKDNQKVGIRFAGVNIPPGATIDKAYLQFQADEATSEITNLTIAGEASANPLTFTTANGNISARTLTNASVSWSPPPWLTVGAAGVEQQTADIAPIIQELVQPPSGWISGNAMVFIITGSGKRVAEAFNGAAAAAPLLHVEYFDLQ